MPEVSFFNFLKRIEAGKEVFPVTIIYGFNEFLGEKIVEGFSKTFLVEKTDFNYRRFYFDIEYTDTTWADIINEAKSASFFVQSRKLLVVIIRDEKKLALTAADKNLLYEYLKKPNPNTFLVIYISMDLTKDDYILLKKSKIAKILQEINGANVYQVDLDKISETEVKEYIVRYLKDANLSITASALDKIFEIKEEDFISILYQLPRLEIADVEGGSIDSADIDKMITGVEAHSIWDLTDAIETEDAGKYLKVLKYLFMNGIKPTLIIGTLVTHYNKIYIAKFLLEHKFPVEAIGKALGQHRFFLKKFIDTARRFSDKRLKHTLQIIYDLDYESKTSGEETARLSLQNFAFRIQLAAAQNRRGR